jgi:hypothetical protein
MANCTRSHLLAVPFLESFARAVQNKTFMSYDREYPTIFGVS